MSISNDVLNSLWELVPPCCNMLFVNRNCREYLEGCLRMAQRRRDYWRQKVHDALADRDMETYRKITRKYTKALEEVMHYEHKLENARRKV